MKPLLQDERAARRREKVRACRRKKEENRQDILNRVRQFKRSRLDDNLPVESTTNEDEDPTNAVEDHDAQEANSLPELQEGEIVSVQGNTRDRG